VSRAFPRLRVDRSTASVGAELRALALVVGVVVALVAFRAVIPLGFLRQFDLRYVAPALGAAAYDFGSHLTLALLMYIVIQPVRRRGPQHGVPRWAALAVTVLAASLVAAGLFRLLVETEYDGEWWLSLSLVLRFAFPAGMLVVVAEFHRREVLSLEAMRDAEAARAALETQTLQARLRTMQAQIEPHFLFNTLANVRRLYETDPAAGETMLARLMEYLRMALPSMRGATSTLGQEAELIRAYLDLQKVRMGRRLDYRVVVPEALSATEVPPMMLLTLIENALKHGLAPQREGGRVEVKASLAGGTLRLEVEDTGRGFAAQTSGGGTGLANIRARLAAMFGPAAELTLVPRTPTGLLAMICMPVPAA
jgi:signal transduction histidine kinase